MPKLIIKQKSEIISVLELDDTQDTYAIGSDKANDLILSDSKIAERHLQIRRINNSYHMSDLGSPFGTVLNGRPIKNRVQLVDGDEIIIGDYIILFTSESLGFRANPYDPPEMLNEITATRSLFNDISDTRFEGIPTETQTFETSTVATLASQAEFETDSVLSGSLDPHGSSKSVEETRCPYVLLAIYGPYTGHRYELNARDTKIGRDLHFNDIVIRRNIKGEVDPSISRRHATISYEKECLYIKDKRSKTRTFVNQIEVPADKRVPVFHNDEIVIVSDQTSTILRVVKKDELDLSRPARAGSWWLRYKLKAGMAVSVITGLVFATLVMALIVGSQTQAAKTDLLTFPQADWYVPPTKVPSNTNSSVPLALSDLNGNGSLEVISADPGGIMYALDGPAGEELWRSELHSMTSDITVTLADINANGLPDIIFGGNDFRIHALDGQSGAHMWSSPLILDMLSAPAVGDINGDDIYDVVVTTSTGKILIGYGTKSSPSWYTIRIDKAISTPASIMDLSGNGSNEIFIGDSDGTLTVIDGLHREIIKEINCKEQLRIQGLEQTNLLQLVNPPGFGDLNNDDITDVVINTSTGGHIALNGRNLTDILFYSAPHNQQTQLNNSATAVAQFNEDNIEDVALISGHRIQIISGVQNNSELNFKQWQIDFPQGALLAEYSALADLNKDGMQDIVIADESKIQILDGRTGITLQEIEQPASQPVSSPLLIADIEGKSTLSIVYATADHNIHCINTTTEVPQNSISWAQLYHDAGHSSRFDYQTPGNAGLLFFIVLAGLTFSASGLASYRSIHLRRLLILSNYPTKQQQ